MKTDTEFAEEISRKIKEIAAQTGMTRKEVALAAMEMINKEKEEDRQAEELIIP